MKIGLIGNMNNNNFALMRYFRDMGLDAHLLLGSNDGKGISEHFKPESDTQQIEKWQPYIHQTSIPDDITASFGFPLSWILSLRTYVRSKFNINITACPPLSEKRLQWDLNGYTHYIGSGIAPAALSRINKSLDIFYPYSIGVEYLGEAVFKSNSLRHGIIGKYLSKKVSDRQRNGILSSKIVINPERSLTELTLNEIGIDSIPMFLPMLYNKEPILKESSSEIFDFIKDATSKSAFTLFSHARLMWKKPIGYSDQEWVEQNKNNDRLIRAFSKLIFYRPELKPILILVDYGPDTLHTKMLVEALKIQRNVIWLPKMERKLIFSIISLIDVGAGEFYDLPGVLWGGTTIEIMSCGKPVIHGLSYTHEEFMNLYNIPLPPIQAARTEDEIFASLLRMADCPEDRRRIGGESLRWFNDFHGEGLARKWASLLIEGE